MKRLLELGVAVPEILLPRECDTTTWATIACDQHTADRAYWEAADSIVQDKPSTLRLMLPEAYLEDKDKDEKIERIHSTMREYVDKGVFAPARRGFVYLERKAEGHLRKGLVAAIDLEKYDWHPEVHALIRATEATIPERIPPRVAIRRGAALDMPHVMLLADDKDGTLIEAVGKRVHDTSAKPLYDGDLMLGGGHITGYEVDGEGERIVENALNALYEKGKQADGSTFLFAVGDGNHSLATAKTIWDEYKVTLPPAERENNPVRYALVEIVNLYDEGLVFRPIHRVLFDVDAIDFLATLVAEIDGTFKESTTSDEMLQKLMEEKAHGTSAIGIAAGGRYVSLMSPRLGNLPVAVVQDILDEYKRGKSKVRLDYIHGDDDTIAFGRIEGNVSIILPSISKDGLFKTIAENGSLPRKCFSMGESCEKRYYVECRRLF